MKVTRSTCCSLKFATKAKRQQLRTVLTEYGHTVNTFIKHFWALKVLPTKGQLLKPIVDIPKTWLSARLRKVAAREALSMIVGTRKRWREKAKIPVHKGRSMYVSSTIADLQEAKNTTEFDAWLVLRCIGNKIPLDLPIKFHKHFNGLCRRGRRLNSYIISEDEVQFAFDIDTGRKKVDGGGIGIDTGINALASTSTGRQYGLDTKEYVERIKRCKHGSKGQKRARRALRQQMDEVAKEIMETPDLRLVVVESLKNLSKNRKKSRRRRLSKNMRRSLGAWAYRYWLERVQARCEDNRVVFRSVPARYTSQRCSVCGHTERANRSREAFLCRKCGYACNADINAAKNIFDYFASGPYGAGFKALVVA
jgi:hypothetical protein